MPYKRVSNRCRYSPGATKIDRFGLDGSKATGAAYKKTVALQTSLMLRRLIKARCKKVAETDSNAVMTPFSSRAKGGEGEEFSDLHLSLSLAAGLLCVQ